jgi:hypothetical protein
VEMPLTKTEQEELDKAESNGSEDVQALDRAQEKGMIRKLGVIYWNREGVRRMVELKSIGHPSDLHVDVVPLVDFLHYMVPYMTLETL